MNEGKSFEGKVPITEHYVIRGRKIETKEDKIAKIRKQNREKMARYLKNHNIKSFNVKIDGKILDKLDKALKKRGLTKKQFLEKAIDRFFRE